MKISIVYILSFITGLFMFLIMDPYFMWSHRVSQDFMFNIPILIIIWLNLKKMNIKDLYLFVFFALILFIAALSKRANVFGLISMVLLAAIPFVTKSFLVRVYKNFNAIYVTIVGISIIVWILVIIGLPIPYQIINPLNSLKTYNYYVYPLLVIPNVYSEGILGTIRFGGPFDEPGVIGTISLLMLFVGKFNLKEKQNIVLLISGLISFSLFFYICLFGYIAYYFFVNKKNIIGFSLVLIVVMFYFATINNDLINQMIWSRLSWNEETKTIIGDNRSGVILDNYFDQIKGTSTFYFGSGDKKLLEGFAGTASYKNAVLVYGFISLGLYIVFFALLAYRQIGKRKELFLFISIMLLTFYQRPSFFAMHYILIFLMIIVANSKTLNGLIMKTITNK